MPNLDVLKVALVLLLIVSIAGLAAWFIVNVAPDIVSTGITATSELNQTPADAWEDVVGLFGPTWGLGWDAALIAVLLFGTVFLLFRIIRWITG